MRALPSSFSEKIKKIRFLFIRPVMRKMKSFLIHTKPFKIIKKHLFSVLYTIGEPSCIHSLSRRQCFFP